MHRIRTGRVPACRLAAVVSHALAHVDAAASQPETDLGDGRDG